MRSRMNSNAFYARVRARESFQAGSEGILAATAVPTGHREDEKQAGFGHSTSWRNYTPALVQSRSMALAGKMARPMVNHQGVYL